MPRVPRKHIVNGKRGGFFHCLNRISDYPGDYPFQNRVVFADFVPRLRHCIQRSCIQCAAFILMGNHFHLILFAERFRKLSRRKLERLAQARWGMLWKLRTCFWSDQRWEKFNRDAFDLSVFMRDFQGPFTTWFNKMFGHRGRLWADRFKCLALEKDLPAVQEQMLYVELNSVRAHLVDLPELYPPSSAFLRSRGQDDWLIQLHEMFPNLAQAKVASFYRGLLLHRGLLPSRQSQAAIPQEVVARELERQFPPGLYLNRCRFMIDGLMMGSKDRMLQELERLTQEGIYQRRRNVTAHFDGLFHTIREQRSHSTW